MMLGKPQGDRQAFDRAFNAELGGKPAGAATTAGGTVSASAPRAPASGLAPRPLAAPVARPCSQLKVEMPSIEILDNAEAGDAEWRFHVIIDGNRQDWNSDGVQDRTYVLNYSWTIGLPDDGKSFRLEAGGIEEDVSSDDILSGLDITYNQGNNWGIGSHEETATASDGDYILRYTISCIPPYNVDLRTNASVNPTSLPAGDQLTYTFFATNDGPRDSDANSLQISLPSSLSNVIATASQGTGCSQSGASLYCNLGGLNAGAQARVSVQADTSESYVGALTATANAIVNSSEQTDTDGSNNTTSTSAQALPKANTGVALSAPALVQRNQAGTTTYQVVATVTNAGPTYAPSVRLTPAIPAGVTLVAAAPSTGSCNGSTGICNLGDMVVNATPTVQYTLSVNSSTPEAAVLSFGATVAMLGAGATEVDPLNNTASRDTRLTFWDLRIGATGPGGEVQSLAYVNGELYAGGSFGVKRWDGSAWSSVGSDGPLGTVYALLPDGAGGLYAGGDFANIGPRLAHWNGSGWSDVGGGVPNGVVYALALGGSDLYVGGQFTQAGTLVTSNIARWDGAAWHKLGVAGVTQGFGSAQAHVRAIAVDGANVYVGGLFKVPANNIVRWNKDSDTWGSLGTGIAYPGGDTVVRAVALLDGRLYVGGRFTSVNGQPASRIAAWEPATQKWMPVGAGMGGLGNLSVNALAVIGGELLASGSFTTAGAASSRHIARWNGAAWAAAGSGADDGSVNALAVGETPLTAFAGGSFTAADNGLAANNVGQYRPAPTDLALAQSIAPNPPVAGQPLDITLSVTNASAAPADAVALRDELPVDVSFTSVTTTQGSCANAAGIVSCDLGAFAAGATATVVVKVNVAATISGPFVNRVWAGAKGVDQNPADNRVSVAPTVDAQADLVATLSAPATAVAGQSLSYTIGVQNNGPAVADAASVTLTLPAGGAKLRGVSGLSCQPVNDYADFVRLRCSLGALSSGASASGTLLFDLLPDMLGPLEATVAATSRISDPNAANNSQNASTDVQASADVKVALAAPASIYQPPQQVGSFSYNATLANAGPSLARNAQLMLALPADATFVAAPPSCQRTGQQLACAAGDLGVGESASFTVDVYVNVGTPHGTVLSATATAQSSAADPQTGDNNAAASSAVSTNPADAKVDVRLSQSSAPTAFAGDTALFTLTAFNSGAVPAGVTITNTLPLDTDFEPSRSDPKCFEVAARTVVCKLDELAVGATRDLVVAALVRSTADAGVVLTNAVVAEADQPEANPADNTTTAEARVETQADLEVTQVGSKTSAAAGDPVTFTFTVSNNGPSQARDVTLSNPKPAGMALQSATASQGSCSITNDAVTCALGNLDARQSLTVDVAMVAGSGTITNTATVASTTADAKTTNNAASANLEIASSARTTRQFGAASITADTFVDLSGGRVQAFGNVWLGDHLYLAGSTDSIVIAGQNVVGEGTVAYLQEKVALFTGKFTGTFSASAATLAPKADVEYKLNTFAGFALGDIGIKKIDLSAGRTEGETTQLKVKADGFNQTLKASLLIDPGLVYGGTVESFTFAVGGVSLKVANATLTTEGLEAATIAMSLPAKWGGVQSTVNDLSITSEGVSLGGAKATVPLPDFQLSGDKVQVKKSSVTIVYDGSALILSGKATVAINLPGNKQESKVDFSISPSGEFSASVDAFTIKLAGASLKLADLVVDNDGVSVAVGVLKLPPSLNESVVTVKNVTISADGLKIGGGAVQLNLPDINIGDGSKVRFSNVKATLQIENDKYAFGIATTIQLRLPQNAQDIAAQARVDTDGKFSGSLNQLTLKIATVTLKLDNVQFNNRGLAVVKASLLLPANLGGASGSLSDVRVGADGLSIGGGSARIPFPDLKLGSANGFSVTKASVEIALAADRTFKITLYGTVNIKVKSVSTMAAGSISVDSQGRFRGKVDEFSLNLAGLEVLVRDVVVNGDELSVAEASLKTPASWGGAGVAVYNLRISPNGVRIGGGRFAIPEIKVGSITLGALYGELREESNGYVISLGGKFRTPGLGGPNCGLNVGATMYVGVNNALVVSLTATDPAAASPQGVSDFQLRQVSVGLSGCRAPIGTTGAYLTRVQGSLTLTQGQTVIDLGVSIADGANIITADADMRMQFNPWQMDLDGAVTIFSIFKAAEMKAKIRPNLFSFDLRVHAVIFEGRASLTAWTDDGSFHLVGRVTMALVIRKGLIDDTVFDIPPYDVRLAEVGAEFGEFHKGNGTVWGLKGWASVLSFKVGFYIDTGGGIDVGNVDKYRLITPPQVQQMRALAARGDKAALSAEDLRLANGYAFNGSDTIIDQPISTSTDLIFALVHKGAAPTLTLLGPAGQRIAPDALPANVTLVETPKDNGLQTLYIVKNAMAGTWKGVLSGDGNDYAYQVFGANPAPVLKDVAALNTSATGARANWALSSDEITTTLDIFVNDGSIETTQTITGENGLPKTITAPLFAGKPLARSVVTKLDGAPSQVDLDLKELKSGTYWVWFNADDGRNPPTRAYAPTPIVVSHEWSDAWTADLALKDHFRGFDLSWNAHPNPDATAYKIEVGTQPGVIENVYEAGAERAWSLDNLKPGQVYYISVLGVDEATGRTSRSETLRAIATGATFNLSATPQIVVAAGASVVVPLTLNTSVDPYPSPVRLDVGDLPDGVAVSFGAPDGMVTPSVGGTTATATITTTPSMVGGTYAIPLRASGDGVQDEVVVQLIVNEPRVEVRVAPAAVELTQRGDSTAVSLSAVGFYGATGPADLDLLDAPPGLLYSFSTGAIAAGGQATLALTDTSELANGTYVLRLRSEVGLQQQFIPLALTVRKPDFRLAPNLSRLSILSGEKVVFAIGVDGENLQGPVTLRLDPRSSPLPSGAAGFASTAARSPHPSLDVVADGTGYLVVETSKDTPPGTYRLVVQGQQGQQLKQTAINLTVFDTADSADLAVEQMAPLTVVVGDLITYKLRVVNYGPLLADQVLVTDDLPTLTTAVSATPSRGTCRVQAAKVICDLYALRRGDYADVTIVARVSPLITPGIDLVNEAAVSSARVEGYDADNTSTHTATAVAQSDLAVSIAGQTATATAGSTMTYSLVAWNNGASQSQGVQVVTTLSAGLALVSAKPSQGSCRSSIDGRVVTCELGVINTEGGAHNAVIALETRVSAAAQGSLTLAADVSGATVDRVLANNKATATTPVQRDVNLAIAHRVVAPELPVAGDNVTYQLIVRNADQSDATNVVVEDELPAQVKALDQITASQGTCSVESGRVTCRLGTVAAKGEAIVTISGRIDPAARTPLLNKATVGSDAGESATSDNTTVMETALTARSDLAVSISSVNPLSFQFTVDNVGASDAHEVTLVGTLPENASIEDVQTPRGSCTRSGSTFTCNLGMLKPLDRVVVSVRTSVAPGIFDVEASARVTSLEHDPRAANNTARLVSSFKTFKLYLPIIAR